MYTNSAALGFSLNPVRGIKKAASGAAKVGKVAGRGAIAAGKGAVAVAMLPHKLLMQAIVKIAVPLARTLCSAPQPILQAGAMAANVSVNVVPLFCTAVRVRNMSQIRTLLPPVLKIAVKVAATGAFPGIVPVLATIKAVPGLKLVPGLSFLAGAGPAVAYDANGYSNSLFGDAGEELAAAAEGALQQSTDRELAAAVGMSTQDKIVAGVTVAAGIGIVLLAFTGDR